MKEIDSIFLAESVTTRSNNLVMINNPKNTTERKMMSPFAKIGRISGQTLRGWLRHAMEKLLISYKISVCHPLASMSVTGNRNKEYYKKDLAIGYHSRGECKAQGGCLIYNLFGDLDQPGNLMVQSVYFYPTTSGNGTATKNVNKLFESVGSGRLEVINNSPRARNQSHQVYMTIENLSGVMIEAPIKLILRTTNLAQETVLLKTLEFLKTMVKEYNFDFLLGGMRTSGYGRAAILPIQAKSSKKVLNKSKLLEDETETNETEKKGTKEYKIQFKLKKTDAENLDKEFQKVIAKEKEKFPIIKEE